MAVGVVKHKSSLSCNMTTYKPRVNKADGEITSHGFDGAPTPMTLMTVLLRGFTQDPVILKSALLQKMMTVNR